ncbi:Uma2 family endonuclease [Oscillatoria sp. CS-180]|uniref:Uma2 family endonuclease n=1 Tax=Oscillatoria sp. CS-180 TaxID=3021720 RepID=UPI00232C069C|nr:Uma2 family endonuclease [Oscillatoria sp. CS-180]MDB9527472.1 Uma2 family endonuclease [Oscillatoria sp. CS-180]
MMIPAVTRDLTFETFIDVEDGNELNEFELVDGRLVLMPEPDDWHEEILEFLSFMFELQYRRMKLRYSVRKRNALMIDNTRGRRPDVAVIDRPATRREDRQPGIRSVPRMIVEIASGNWSTDLVEKQEEYEALQVPEFWIVDYRGQIPAKYCQRGKGKKVIVLMLEDGVYRKAEYVEGETVPCLTFPELELTVEQVLAAEEA